MNQKPMIPRQPMCNVLTWTPEEMEAFNEAKFSLEYMTAKTFRDQIDALCNYLRKGKILVSYERIGKLFNESKHWIWDQHKNNQQGNRNDGRPCSLSSFQIGDVYQNICSCHRSNNPIYPTYNNVSYYIWQKFNKYIPDDTLRHIFSSEFSDFFKIIESDPKDADRIEVSLKDIENNFNILKNEIQGVPPNFVFNLDEVGCHDYVDPKKK